MSKAWSGRTVAAARAYWRARLSAGPLPCYRCGKPVYLVHRWQVEHIRPRSAGGSLTSRTNQWVSHGRCNEAHGGRLGAAMTNGRRRQPVAPVLAPERDRGIRGWSGA